MGLALFNGHSMVGDLKRVLVCPPLHAGWDDPVRVAKSQELGFHHAPIFSTAQEQHADLCRVLRDAGAIVEILPASSQLSLDAAYAHDASLATDFGLILMRPGKKNRIPEGEAHRAFCRTAEIPVLGEITAPGTTEAGDMVWLDSKTLLIGLGYRTNASGIAQMRALLQPHGIEVLQAPLPYGAGPSECLHLMSLMSVLDEQTMVVDLPWLAVETVELLRSRGFRFIEIDATERATLACNVLSLGSKRLVALRENPKTNARLQAAGFDVRTFPGSEVCINGSGGPTCLTRPLARA
jgi:N-dimethylarginine dimethylaminohydrolase